MDKAELALDKFKEGYNCAQAVLYAYCDNLNISRDLALKLASGFGAGMGRKQEVCGAVSGGILVLNLLYGRGENEAKAKQEMTYSKVKELIDKFALEYKTVNCKKLLDGCDLLTLEGQEKFKSNKMMDRCGQYVNYTVKILEEIIWEEIE